MTTFKQQRGVVLVVALIIMIVITLLTISGMSGGIMEMRMSVNEEMRIAALQAAQAAVDEIAERIIEDPVETDLTPLDVAVAGLPGDALVCTSALPSTVSSCTDASLSLVGQSASANDKVAITRLAPEQGNPNPTRIRGREFSVDRFRAAFFQIEAEHDATATAGSRARIVQGYMALIPNNE